MAKENELARAEDARSAVGSNAEGDTRTLRPTFDEESLILKEAIQIVRAHANMERIRMAQGHNSSDYDAARNAYDVELIAAWNRRSPDPVRGELAEALKWFIDDIDGTHTVMLEFDAAVLRARAAISKAKGEQP